MKTKSDKSACEMFIRLAIASILLTAFGFSGCSSASLQNRQDISSNQNQSAGNIVPTPPAQTDAQTPEDKNKKSESRNQSDVSYDDIEDDGVLIDFRSELAFDTPDIAPAKKRVILKAVYGNDQADDIEINSIVEGSFTQASVKETAYLLQVGGARAAEPSSLEKTKLAIFQGDNLTAKFDVKNYNFILRTSNLDRDGLEELLLSGSNYQMGESTTWAKLVEIEDKQLRDVKDFSTVLKDSCENPTAQNREIKAALIKYDSQNASQIVSSYYRAACSARKDGKLYPDIFKLISDKSIEKSKN